MLIRLPRLATVWPIHSAVKSWLRARRAVRRHDPHHMLRNDVLRNSACAIGGADPGYGAARARARSTTPGAARDRPPACATGSSSELERPGLAARRRPRPRARHPRQPGELPPAPAGEVRPGRGGPRRRARPARPGLARRPRPAGSTINIDELEAQPGGAAAAEVFRRNAAAWAHAVVDAGLRAASATPGKHRSVTDTAVRLTRDEARELAARARRGARALGRAHPRADDEPERRTYLCSRLLLPHPGLPGAGARAATRLMPARLRLADPPRSPRAAARAERRHRRPRRPAAAGQALPRACSRPARPAPRSRCACRRTPRCRSCPASATPAAPRRPSSRPTPRPGSPWPPARSTWADALDRRPGRRLRRAHRPRRPTSRCGSPDDRGLQRRSDHSSVRDYRDGHERPDPRPCHRADAPDPPGPRGPGPHRVGQRRPGARTARCSAAPRPWPSCSAPRASPASTSSPPTAARPP